MITNLKKRKYLMQYIHFYKIINYLVTGTNVYMRNMEI